MSEEEEGQDAAEKSVIGVQFFVREACEVLDRGPGF